MAFTINSLGMMQPPVDGRLCFGNGYAFGCFVGPLELPEKPIYKVHDKISRLWLGYSSLFNEHSNIPPANDDKEALRFYNVYKSDERERPVSHIFPEKEVLTFDKKTKNVLWDYKDDRYRKIVIKAAETTAKTIVTQKSDENCGKVKFENICGKKGGELTVVLSFAPKMSVAESKPQSPLERGAR